eukprot:CAMPEP_0196589238 /NCGR_PEP_ID=MMETSP1081-20130531/63061_1 /TAXON_ID=36882 /ORGANISM="Pyramimonas amylifera, Strain CCMP720" /LENGTH=281 /DNA_ID=CAMNT_0041911981 /DNA_START=325 /DNA_END=1170 /DNA_ORIENTATION=-
MVDYFELLGVTETASRKEVKQAYYSLAKECHPDLMGDTGHEACKLLNEAYDVLSDEKQRPWYTEQLLQAKEDFQDGYTGQARSKWKGEGGETRAVFVDECTCIGCKNCIWAAPATFRLEPTYGRSYAFGQWLNDEEALQTAIESCPVDCIHWVDKEQLPVLEFVMQNIERVQVGIMMSGQGNIADPFDVAASYAKKRAEKIKNRARKENRRQESAAVQAARKAASDLIIKQREKWSSFIKSSRRGGREWTVPPERAIVPFVEGVNTEMNKDIESLKNKMKA